MKPSQINVLIACEESQVECLAFRERGFRAFSCDLQPCSGHHPEYHVTGDCMQLLHDDLRFKTDDGRSHHVAHWHLVIAHPPCTYLSKVSASNSKGGIINDPGRIAKGLIARDFFMSFFAVTADYIAVENPVPLHIFNLPRPTTMIQPYHYGAPWSKRTCLWLVNLPPLLPTIYNPKHRSWVHCTRGGKKRSKSFPQIAKAMADQWGDYILTDITNKRNNRK